MENNRPHIHGREPKIDIPLKSEKHWNAYPEKDNEEETISVRVRKGTLKCIYKEIDAPGKSEEEIRDEREEFIRDCIEHGIREVIRQHRRRKGLTLVDRLGRERCIKIAEKRAAGLSLREISKEEGIPEGSIFSVIESIRDSEALKEFAVVRHSFRPSEITQIRLDWAKYEGDLDSFSKEYGTSLDQIQDILTGESYKEVGGPIYRFLQD